MKNPYLIFMLSLLIPLSLVHSQARNIDIPTKASDTLYVPDDSSASITGTITDSETDDPLPGANIYIQDTDIGIASDIDGNYILANVPPGSHTIIVTYIGYEKAEATVHVTPNAKKNQNFELVYNGVEEVDYFGSSYYDEQLSAINQQLSAPNITNVVAKERILELPDDNAANVLSRMPGISLMNNDQVVVRGVEARYNTVLINGIPVPSTMMNDRSTNLGFISSRFLSGIEVIKTLTPDMDANAIGGVVNLKMNEAVAYSIPARFNISLITQGNYNTQDNTLDNFNLWANISKRFLDRKLGINFQVNADRLNGGQDIASASFGRLEEAPYGQASYQMDSFTLTDQWNEVNNNGASLVLDYILPNGKIVLQNTYISNSNNNTSFRNAYNLGINTGEYSITRDKYTKDLMINALQTEYNFGDLKAELSLSHSLTNKKTDLRYGDEGQNTYFTNPVAWPFGFVDGDTTNPVNYFTERSHLTLDDALDISINESDALGAQIRSWVVTRDEEFEQHIFNASLDFMLPVQFSQDISSHIKFGGKLTRSTRENDVEAKFTGADPDFYSPIHDYFPNHPDLSPTNPLLFSDVWDRDYKRGKYFLEGDYEFKYAFNRNLMDRLMKQSMARWIPPTHETNSRRDDFDGAEVFTAGYLMGELDLGSDLTFLGGARYEDYNMKYDAPFVYAILPVYGAGVFPDTLNSVDRSDDHIFPNAQLRYWFEDWAYLRFAYSKAISRPDYIAIMPNIYFEPGTDGLAQTGNTELKPAIATNYDAHLSIYDNKIGLFTLGGFYKKINDVFYQTDIFYQNLGQYDIAFPDDEAWSALNLTGPTPSQQISTFLNNPEPAFIKGIEMEWQTNFWYLPEPFYYLVLNINYTRAWSDMDYQQIRNISVPMPPDSLHPRGYTEYITTDTLRNARLLYQADHILNIALGFEYKGFSGRISCYMLGDVMTHIGSRPEEDQFTGNIYRWDFSLQQRLPIEGLSLALTGINVLHNPVYTYQKFRREGGKIVKNKMSIAYFPSIFQLSLRYSL